MNDDSDNPATAAALSLHNAFVVHITSDLLHGAMMAGRVEHVPSGRSIRFSSVAELAEFMQQVLLPSPAACREDKGELAPASRRRTLA